MPDNRAYRPIVTASTAIDYYFWKKDPLHIAKHNSSLYQGDKSMIYFHLPAFVIYCLLGFLLFLLMLKIFNISYRHEWNLYTVLFFTLFYLLHPGNAETVNYISARSDLYSTFFVVLALWCYASLRLCRRFYIYLLPVAAGILTKETAVMFPFFLFFYILFFENKVSLTRIFNSQRKLFFKTIYSCLPAIIFTVALAVIVQYIVYSQTTGNGILHSGGKGYLELFKYQITQPYILLTYFSSFFFPFHLSSESDMTVFSNYADVRLYIGLLFLLLLFFAVFFFSRQDKYRPVSFGLLWFIFAAIPTSFVTVLTQVANSHRLLYLFVGLNIAIGFLLYMFIVKISPVFNKKEFKKIIVLLACIVLSGFAYFTYQRNNVWQSEETLWKDILEKSPQSPRAMLNYGLTQMNKKNYFEAEYYFLKAKQIWPYWPYIYINLGILKEHNNQISEAESYFLDAIKYSNKNNPDAYYYYAYFLYNQKHLYSAIPYLQHAVDVSPGFLKPRFLLMTIYTELGQWGRLEALATESLVVAPDNVVIKNFKQVADVQKKSGNSSSDIIEPNISPEYFLDLSLQYYNMGEFQKCIDACNEALKLKPDYAEAYNNICSAYNAMKMWNKGIEACEQALKLNPNYELARNNLNWAQANIKK
ncbi:MAG: hypothetical protein PHR81_05190 [Bacteroidales bacterium]|nr:hypothetical protein [Bacteroidales bacterium]MDD4214186.1 hypothetical protein [Bacteroidales bacterium]